MKHFVIAIDGEAGSGKGTLGAQLAKRLGFLHLDTGALYRCATVLVLESGINPKDEKAVTAIASKAKIEAKLVGETEHYFLNNRATGQILLSGILFPNNIIKQSNG